MRSSNSVLMSPGEVQAVMSNPHGLLLLMAYEDEQYSHWGSVAEPGEMEPWPTARYTFLKERGRAIMLEDLELWDDSIKQCFGFEVAKPQRKHNCEDAQCAVCGNSDTATGEPT